MKITEERLSDWVSRGESETQEFKSSTGQRSEAAKAVCAMLNHKGGRVIFGVDGKGRVVGQEVTDKTVSDVAAYLRMIEPPAFPTVERVALSQGREAIVVSIEQGSRRPYTFQGKPYRRLGTTNAAMSREDYNRMLLEQLHAASRWENQSAEGWSVKDLDGEEIVRTVEEAVRRGRSEDPGTRAPTDLLRGLALTKDGALLRAAVMLFARGERLETEYPQCFLKLARFKGRDKTEFVDNRQYHGNAFDLLLRAERFLRDHLPVAGRVVPNLFEREDDPLYPPLALREALANAFCHRDYSIGGGSVGIAIYDDRLEISSSGSLHFGLTVPDLYKPHESLPWNPIIASVFFKRGIIETWGRGTIKMAEMTERAGLPRPEIEEIAGGVVVRFRATRYLPPTRIGHDLADRQREILDVLASNGALRLGEILPLLKAGATERALRDDLNLLRRLKLVGCKGYARGARWHLKREG
ncbi:MAG: AAA family ATPase [Elusimicrobia bacterium GWA2_69_24]|nr:MAG: AAA family ATPase [Elusimicrobia bacterium GWA2_69_24]HBL16418.1 AAA family ATPase [Elusimicrobiota bacterium]